MAEEQAGKTAAEGSTRSGIGPPTPAGRARDWSEVTEKSGVPAGLWMRCPGCAAMSYRKTVAENLDVCPDCDHHYRIGGDDRVRQLVDPGSFEALWADLAPTDPLKFVDRKPYRDRLVQAQQQTGHKDALICGRAFIKGRGVVLAVMNNQFIMASMGAVVGEKIARCAELAVTDRRPLVIVSSSGGARMMESALSLAQMAKTSAALARLDDAGGLYISVLTDPTTGGVTASFAMLGDLIFAEPGALIGFAGPRVIANTVRQELPEGFQRAEFLCDRGFVDRVVHRHQLRSEISRAIDYAGM